MVSSVGIVVAGVIGCLCVLLGGVFFPVFDQIIHDEVVKQVLLSNNESQGYGEWRDPPGDIHMQFYFLDLVNKAEVQAGEKPYFVEVGPFSYREQKPKRDVVYNANKTRANYTFTSTYEFDPEMSKFDPSYKITTINIPLLTVANQLQSLPSFVQKIVMDLIATLEDETIFYEISVQDLLWGYEDPLLKLLYKFDPKLVPETTFGLFVGRNGSDDGVYEIHTGKDDVMQTANIISWRGMKQLPWWTTDEANAINGSDGSYSHPFWKKTDTAYVFSSDICRSISVEYEKETQVKGIQTMKFSAPEYSFLNGSYYPPNAGFCLPDIDHCLPSGLLNVSKCQLGAPIVMSLPHFLFADPVVLDSVYGLTPDRDVHNTYFNVEPYTGGPLIIQKKIQVNAYCQSFKQFRQMKNLPTLAFPVLWLNESATITDDGAASLRKSLTTPILITAVIKWGLIALGALFIIMAVSCFFTKGVRTKTRSLSTDSIINAKNGDLSSPPVDEHRPLLS